jgi:Ca2+-binding EF-hand superfamily protein
MRFFPSALATMGFAPSHFRRLGPGAMALFTIASLLPVSVEAQTKPKADPEQTFKRRDANGDGFLSEDEFVSAAKDQDRKEKMKRRFTKLDANGDGKISFDEFKASLKE